MITLTGSSGFVGRHIISYFKYKFYISTVTKDFKIQNLNNIVIHLAGKAHDLSNSTRNYEYYKVNTELTKDIFDNFLSSDSKIFIMLSSVKAVSDKINIALTEDCIPNPKTHYGKSKLLAEKYILSKEIPVEKKVFILRPCMIHGPENKGNLNLLYKVVKKGFPWPLASFNNKRSFCSIDNLCFIINELIENENIQSGVYNISDDESISTNEIISLIGKSLGKKNLQIRIPKILIEIIAKVGDILKLPLNTERLAKLTETYIVDNSKIKKAIGKPLPISCKEGLLKTLKSFSQNV